MLKIFSFIYNNQSQPTKQMYFCVLFFELGVSYGFCETRDLNRMMGLGVEFINLSP